MNKINKIFSTLCLYVILCSSIQANLILNNSFEDTGTISPSQPTWRIYDTIPHWSSTRGIEIWNDGFIVPTYHGNNVLELNAHDRGANTPYSIFQSFNTVIDQKYKITFMSRKRQSGSERFSVSVGDLYEVVINLKCGEWSEYTYIFTALSAITTLTFTSLDPFSDHSGNLLDEINVQSIAEPSIFLLILFSLALIICIQYFMRKN